MFYWKKKTKADIFEAAICLNGTPYFISFNKFKLRKPNSHGEFVQAIQQKFNSTKPLFSFFCNYNCNWNKFKLWKPYAHLHTLNTLNYFTVFFFFLNSVRKVELTMYQSLLLRTRKSIRCPYQRVSLISRFILQTKYELFVETNEIVRNIGVSVERVSTVFSFISFLCQ